MTLSPSPKCVILCELTEDDDVYYYIRWRLKLEGETENMGVCTKERKCRKGVIDGVGEGK